MIEKKGWAKPANSQRWHYFQDGRSLCAVWVYYGDFRADDQKGPRPQGQEDCPKCLRMGKQ